MNEEHFKIEKTKDNYDIVKIKKDNKWIYIGSKYNMQRELDMFMNQVEEDSIYIIFGFASGEHIKKIRERYKDAIIKIFEPNEHIFKYAETLKFIKNDSNILIEKCNENDILNSYKYNLSFIDEFDINRIKIISFSNYNKIYDKEYRYILKQINDEVIHLMINRNTKIGFSKNWFTTFNENLPYMTKSVLFDNYKDKYKNKPAIIVSAGPSLDKNVDLLKGIEDEFFIITGGRPLSGLIEKNIIPALAIVVDPGDVNYTMMKNVMENTNVPLLFSELSNEKVVSNYNGYKIFSTYSEFIEESLNKDNTRLMTYGSVAHNSVSAAILLGCNPIIFIGQDFAYTNDAAHSLELENKYKSNTFEMLKSDNDLYVEDVNNDIVRTSRLLNMYRIGMEKIIADNPETLFINATEGGARILGTMEMTLQDAIKKYKGNNVEKIKCLEPEKTFRINVIDNLKNSIEELNKIKVKCEIAVQNIDKLKLEYNPIELNNLIKYLDEIDYDIKKQFIIKYLVYPIIYNAIEESGINKEKDYKLREKCILDMNERLYKNLNITIEESIKILKNTLRKIKN